MTNPTDHYKGIAHRLVKALDDMIIEAVEEALNDDPNFPRHAEDEVGEKYIDDKMGEVTRLIIEELSA